MKFTGERVVPDDMHFRPDVYSEHLVRYAIALKYCSMNNVLDISCGTGYGTNLLGSVSNSIAGGDNDLSALEYARKKYGLKNLRQIDIEKQTIDQVFNQKFHIIVSFETIEHIENPDFFLKNVKKSLLPNGLFMFSIPVKNDSEYHKQWYEYGPALKFGNNIFKPITTLVQRIDAIIPSSIVVGDFNKHGTYIIKVMT